MKKFEQPNFEPVHQVMVIGDQLCPGVEFCQGTKSGSLWVLFLGDDDRLFKWEPNLGRWKQIKSSTISDRKKQQLRLIPKV